jgi:hypothetical protein
VWFLEGGLAAIVVTVLLGLIAQSVSAQASQGAPTQTKSSAYQKMIDLSGPITFERPSGKPVETGTSQSSSARQATDHPTVTIKCTELTVALADSHGKTLGSTTAAAGSEPGTCTYKLRGRVSTSMSLTVTESSTDAVAVQARSGHVTFQKLRAAPTVVKWQNGSSQTVPLTVTVEKN